MKSIPEMTAALVNSIGTAANDVAGLARQVAAAFGMSVPEAPTPATNIPEAVASFAHALDDAATTFEKVGGLFRSLTIPAAETTPAATNTPSRERDIPAETSATPTVEDVPGDKTPAEMVVLEIDIITPIATETTLRLAQGADDVHNVDPIPEGINNPHTLPADAGDDVTPSYATRPEVAGSNAGEAVLAGQVHSNGTDSNARTARKPRGRRQS